MSTGPPPLRWDEQATLQITATEVPAGPPKIERRAPRPRVAAPKADKEVKRLQAVVRSLKAQLDIVSQVWAVG